jgi:hypothetical protein
VALSTGKWIGASKVTTRRNAVKSDAVRTAPKRSQICCYGRSPQSSGVLSRRDVRGRHLRTTRRLGHPCAARAAPRRLRFDWWLLHAWIRRMEGLLPRSTSARGGERRRARTVGTPSRSRTACSSASACCVGLVEIGPPNPARTRAPAECDWVCSEKMTASVCVTDLRQLMVTKGDGRARRIEMGGAKQAWQGQREAIFGPLRARHVSAERGARRRRSSDAQERFAEGVQAAITRRTPS